MILERLAASGAGHQRERVSNVGRLACARSLHLFARMKRSLTLSTLFLAPWLAACGGDPSLDTSPSSTEQPYTSAEAELYDLEFDGELLSASATNLAGQVKSQLMYTVGQRNAEHGVGQLGRLKTSNLKAAANGAGLYKITYHAVLPTAINLAKPPGASVALVLPRRADLTGQTAFTTKYKATCADEPGDVTVGNFWYHYRPAQSGCVLADADVVRLTASVKRSTLNSSGKYPEYQRVWEDGRLSVVAIFAKDQPTATTNDVGISAFNEFVDETRLRLRGSNFTNYAERVSPSTTASGVVGDDVTFYAERPLGGEVVVTALLVNKMATEGAAFTKRYNELSSAADVIMYNGHAGLGANVQALAQKGTWVPRKYQVFLMNGCDTFAYGDQTLENTRKLVNPDDPSGGKYMDQITNAMPAYFSSLTTDAMALFDALLADTQPASWRQVVGGFDDVQVASVTYEENNVFTPDYDEPAWNGFAWPKDKREVALGKIVEAETEELPAGDYEFVMAPNAGYPGGDADLYLRAGSKPVVASTWKCKSYGANSNERCAITLTTPQKIHLLVRGDRGALSKFNVEGWARRQ